MEEERGCLPLRNIRQGVRRVGPLQSARRREMVPRQNKEFCDRGRALRVDRDSDSKANHGQNTSKKYI